MSTTSPCSIEEHYFTATAMPHTAYIVEGCRSALGKNKGSLSGVHPADLGAHVVDALIDRCNIDGKDVDDVIMGCVGSYGAQAGNIARFTVLSSKKLPQTVPGVTVDRQCGSSQQAVHFAAQAVMSGTQDIVIAGGVEVMSLIPIGSQVMDAVKVIPSRGHPTDNNNQGFKANYGDKMAKFGLKQPSQFVGAELLVRKYKMTKDELDQLSAGSHQKAMQATQEGKFVDEIVPITVKDKEGNEKVFKVDEGIRPGTTVEGLSKLKTMMPQGQLTAGNASQISDGAAALLIVNERALAKYPHLKPKAKIHTMALSGCDPIVMLEGPVFAAKTALRRAGLTINDIDLYEVNEAFAPVPLAFVKGLKADPAKLNVNGSAIALGHALGSTGARLFTSLIHEMDRRKSKYGLVTICEGGGTANATIIERVDGPVGQVAKI